MLLSVPEIVFQIVALGLKGIVILVLHLPTGPTCEDELGYCLIRNRVIGGKRVFVSHFAVRTADYQCTPIDQQSLLAIFERHPIEIAVGISFLNLPSPLFRHHGWQVDTAEMFIEGGVRFRAAHQDEVELLG